MANRMAFNKIREEDIESIVKWNEDKSEEFLCQWSGKRAYTYPLSEDQIIIRMKNEDIQIYVLRDKDKILATVELGRFDKVNKSARLSRLLVDPSKCGKGYGSKCLEELEKEAINEYKLKTLELGVYEFNIGAKKLYERLGYSSKSLSKDDLDSKWNSYTLVKEL